MADHSDTGKVSRSPILDPSGLQVPTTSSDPSLAFDTWRTPNANRPVLVQAEVVVEGNGVSNSNVQLEIDESGGTSFDYSLNMGFVDSTENSGAVSRGITSALVPAGGSYKIRNANDPGGANSIDEIREWTL